MRAIAALSIVAALCASAVPAQETLARLSGQVDGAPEVWHLAEVGGETGSFWADMGTLHQITVLAFAEPGGGRIEGAVEVSLTLDSRSDPMGVMGAQVTYFGEDLSRPYAIPPGGEDSVAVELADSRIDGDRLHLRGRLSAPLLRVIDAAAQRFDAADSIDIDLDFEVTLQRL